MSAAVQVALSLVGVVDSADGLLLERLRAGDGAALADIYDAHHEPVRAFARRMIGDDASAEDLVQETFLAFAQAAKRYRGDAALRTYLLSIAVNRARHHVRAASRRRAAMARLEREPSPARDLPDDEAHRARLAAALLRALDDLPIEQRAAFVLCEVEERTSAEAGRILGVPDATVRTRIFHAKKKLSEALTRQGLR
jgi:RNA polymerase sigma-70 factor (ECF subfamily)